MKRCDETAAGGSCRGIDRAAPLTGRWQGRLFAAGACILWRMFSMPFATLFFFLAHISCAPLACTRLHHTLLPL